MPKLCHLTMTGLRLPLLFVNFKLELLNDHLVGYHNSDSAKSSNFKYAYSVVQNFTIGPCGASVADHKGNKNYWQVQPVSVAFQLQYPTKWSLELLQSCQGIGEMEMLRTTIPSKAVVQYWLLMRKYTFCGRKTNLNSDVFDDKKLRLNLRLTFLK